MPLYLNCNSPKQVLVLCSVSSLYGISHVDWYIRGCSWVLFLVSIQLFDCRGGPQMLSIQADLSARHHCYSIILTHVDRRISLENTRFSFTYLYSLTNPESVFRVYSSSNAPFSLVCDPSISNKARSRSLYLVGILIGNINMSIHCVKLSIFSWLYW